MRQQKTVSRKQSLKMQPVFAVRCFLFAVLFFAFLLPLTAAAQTSITQTIDQNGSVTQTQSGTTPSGQPYQFQRQGVFDCNQSGAHAMSVGALGAIGGAYVPVSDAAVELNTGTLVYKECVLREVVDRESESALTGYAKQDVNDTMTGRSGAPLISVSEGAEQTQTGDATFLYAFLKNDALWQQVNPDMQAALKRAAAQYYEGERSGLQATSLKCPYQGSLNAYWAGQGGTGDFWGDLWNASQPQCDPVIENYFLQDIWQSQIARALQYQQDQLNWGRGFYSRTDNNPNPLLQQTVTPSSVVQESFQQILGTGVQKLVNANDIGQMVGALYAGITTQVIGDQGGLSGLTRSVGNQPSYLDQVARESATGLQGAAQNAALQILAAQQQIESAFYQAMGVIVSALTQTQTQLKAAENQCWTQIIQRACATPLAADNTCTATTPACTTDPVMGQQNCPQSYQLKVATSTAFSSAVIAAKITPLAGPAAQNVRTSQQALQLIANLIQGVANTSSLDAQRVALAQLDNLVATHQLHSQTDAQNASQQQSATADQMSSLLQTTAQVWGGSGTDSSNPQNISWDGTTNPGNGWCNVNNATTISAWQQAWKK